MERDAKIPFMFALADANTIALGVLWAWGNFHEACKKVRILTVVEEQQIATTTYATHIRPRLLWFRLTEFQMSSLNFSGIKNTQECREQSWQIYL